MTEHQQVCFVYAALHTINQTTAAPLIVITALKEVWSKLDDSNKDIILKLTSGRTDEWAQFNGWSEAQKE